MVALIVVLAAPAARRVQLVCRYTGQVLSDDDEEQLAEEARVQIPDCCERRVVAGLAPATTIDPHRGLAPVGSAIPVVSSNIAVENFAPSAFTNEGAPSIGPPIFLATRVLLI
jgi:hypothetical protein